MYNKIKYSAAFTIAAALIVPPASLWAASPQQTMMGVAAFDFTDSSGETRISAGERQARLVLFRNALRNRLGSAAFNAADLPCVEAENCSAASMKPEELLQQAKNANADYLVFGQIHKMSTLVGWGRINVLDVKSQKLLFDRVISFRGDNDAAFVKAAEFSAKDIGRTIGAPDPVQGRGIR